MKTLTTVLVAALLAVSLASPAAAQTGYYDWTISTSLSDPFANTAASVPSPLYVWYQAGCNSDAAQPGMSAAEFDINAVGTTAVAVVAQAPFLNAGSGLAVLLAVGGCPTGPAVAAQIFMSSAATDAAVGLKPSAANGVLGTVDCDVNPSLFNWPDQVRVIGFATDGYSGERQDHGNGCTANAIEGGSWGSVKSLYR